jgi:hypothetical protein
MVVTASIAADDHSVTMTRATRGGRSNRAARRPSLRLRSAVVVTTALAVALVGTAAGATTPRSHVRAVSPGPGPGAVFPLGVPDRHEPSGMAPPSDYALPGYVQSYVTDFTGTSLPTGWYKFLGHPDGNDQTLWAAGHVIVGGGIVRLLTFRRGRTWVTGGMCQCGVGHAYGAYFVRSRVTGPGPDEDELLWPVKHVWPPEVDFNETDYSVSQTSWTVHYGTSQWFVQGTESFDLTQWHTWGVIWTPTTLTFTIDGVPWGTVTDASEVPHRAMTLDIDQEARCVAGSKWNSCPTGEVALQIDWVAEYAKAPPA